MFVLLLDAAGVCVTLTDGEGSTDTLMLLLADALSDGDADFGLAFVAEDREGERDAAAVVEAEDEDMAFASQLQDRGQVIFAASVGRLGFSIEAQHTVAGERGDGLGGVLLRFNEFNRSGPLADGQGLDEVFFDADTALATSALAVGLGFGALFGWFWLVFGLFHEGKAKQPPPIGNQRLGRVGKKR